MSASLAVVGLLGLVLVGTLCLHLPCPRLVLTLVRRYESTLSSLKTAIPSTESELADLRQDYTRQQSQRAQAERYGASSLGSSYGYGQGLSMGMGHGAPMGPPEGRIVSAGEIQALEKRIERMKVGHSCLAACHGGCSRHAS